jgi:hypothetical protein
MCPTVARMRKRFAQHGPQTAVHLNHPLYVPYSADLMALEGRHSAASMASCGSSHLNDRSQIHYHFAVGLV